MAGMKSMHSVWEQQQYASEWKRSVFKERSQFPTIKGYFYFNFYFSIPPMKGTGEKD